MLTTIVKCPIVLVTLKNDLLAALGSIQGTYELSLPVNGKQSWISTSKAIWYSSDYNAWLIGELVKLGSNYASVAVVGEYGEVDEISNDWMYVDGSNWIIANANDISVVLIPC